MCVCAWRGSRGCFPKTVSVIEFSFFRTVNSSDVRYLVEEGGVGIGGWVELWGKLVGRFLGGSFVGRFGGITSIVRVRILVASKGV